MHTRDMIVAMNNEKMRHELLKQEQNNPELSSMRTETCLHVAASFQSFGEILEVSGHLIGDDRQSGASPFGFGSDEVYGMSLLLRIGSELTKNCAELFDHKQTYAAAALLRQIVEVEYLAWAFENRTQDAETWLRSDKEIRWQMFTPAKLRKAAGGKFRGKDYGYHCDLGGHPTPSSITLLSSDMLVTQLLISDLIGHMDGIWGHFIGWAKQRPDLNPLFIELQEVGSATGKKLATWKTEDPLIGLGPPP